MNKQQKDTGAYLITVFVVCVGLTLLLPAPVSLGIAIWIAIGTLVIMCEANIALRGPEMQGIDLKNRVMSWLVGTRQGHKLINKLVRRRMRRQHDELKRKAYHGKD